MREVVAPLRATLLTDADLRPVFPFQQAATLFSGRRTGLQLQGRKNSKSCFPPPLGDFAHLIGAQFPRLLHHAHNPPIDVVFPHLFHLPDNTSDLAVVEIDVSVSEAEYQESTPVPSTSSTGH